MGTSVKENFRQRGSDEKLFRENYEGIDWSKVTPVNPRPQDFTTLQEYKLEKAIEGFKLVYELLSQDKISLGLIESCRGRLEKALKDIGEI